MRKIALENNEYYHIFNRGVDKREIFDGIPDYFRFLKSLKEFNQKKPVVSLYIADRLKRQGIIGTESLRDSERLVEIIAYCLNPNHYHLILRQLKTGGISEFMKRIGTGYTSYFNYRQKRSGVLFQGKFKVEHIGTNEKLIYLSAYVNGNYIVHGIKDGRKFSSLEEYKNGKKFLCNTEYILNQFRDVKQYLNYVENTVKEIHEIREDMKRCLIE